LIRILPEVFGFGLFLEFAKLFFFFQDVKDAPEGVGFVRIVLLVFQASLP